MRESTNASKFRWVGFLKLQAVLIYHATCCSLQIGICKRMIKEVASYEKEVVQNENRVQKMRDDGKDIYGNVDIIICTLSIR